MRHFGLAIVLTLAACGGGSSGGDGGSGSVDAARVCFDEACATYCEGDLLVSPEATLRCPTELGSVCEVMPGQRIKCTCGSATAAGVCFSETERGLDNSGEAVWATCYEPRDELSFEVCAPGGTCSDDPKCICHPEPDTVCQSPAVCPGDPDCV